MKLTFACRSCFTGWKCISLLSLGWTRLCLAGQL